MKLKKGGVDFRSSDNGLLALVWKDKKDVRIPIYNAHGFDGGHWEVQPEGKPHNESYVHD